MNSRQPSLLYRVLSAVVAFFILTTVAPSVASAAPAIEHVPAVESVSSMTTTANASTAAYPTTCRAGTTGANEVRFGAGVQYIIPRGQFCLAIHGSNSFRQFVWQSDGNLVLYRDGRPLWSSGTAGRGNLLILQSDGNAVIYDGRGQPIWWTGTNSSTNRGRLWVLQYDDNVVLYRAAGGAAWASDWFRNLR